MNVDCIHSRKQPPEIEAGAPHPYTGKAADIQPPGNISYIGSPVGPALLLALMWAAAIFFVNPLGNFPLNDDWAYARPIRSFLTHGVFDFTSWPSMTLIGQILQGTAVTKLLGFSFTILRGITLIWGYIGLLYSFLLFRSITGTSKLPFLFTLAIFFNPIFLSLSFTFMTDIPFFGVTAMALYYNYNFLNRGRVRDLLAATGAVILSVLIRQPGIVLPLAFAITSFFFRRCNFSRKVFFVTQFVIALSVLLGYELHVKYALGYSRGFTMADMNFVNMLLENPAHHLLRFCLTGLKIPIYFGLFTIIIVPQMIVLLRSMGGNRRLILPGIAAGLAWGCITIFLFYKTDRSFPFSGGNIINQFGIGPVFMFSVKGLSTPPEWFWAGILLLSELSCALLVAIAILHIQTRFKKNPPAVKLPPPKAVAWFRGGQSPRLKQEEQYCSHLPSYSTGRASGFHAKTTGSVYICAHLCQYVININLLATIICLLLYLPIVSVISFFDRYLLLPLLLLLIMLCHIKKNAPRLPEKAGYTGTIPLVLLCIISSAGTRDYLEWNRARWNGLNYLTDTLGILPEKIDGGFEYNAWYLYGKTPGPAKNWWWVQDDEYVVSFSVPEGYLALKEFPYQRLIPYKKEFIMVSRRLKT